MQMAGWQMGKGSWEQPGVSQVTRRIQEQKAHQQQINKRPNVRKLLTIVKGNVICVNKQKWEHHQMVKMGQNNTMAQMLEEMQKEN